LFSQWSSPLFILQILIVLLSLVVHEFSHALAADLQGDKTARYNGRLTLNPLAHLELVGLIMILFAPIGWARPVPINPNNFRNRRVGYVLTVAAGPISNLVLAVIAFFRVENVLFRRGKHSVKRVQPPSRGQYFAVHLQSHPDSSA
jgi:Zn-dependent protease